MKKDFKINLLVLFPGLQGQRRQKGVSLYLAIIILSIFLGISLGLSLILITQIKMIRGMEESVKAFYAADAGLEKVLLDRNNPSPISRTYLDNGSSYQVFVARGEDEGCSVEFSFCIRSIGFYRGIRRAIEAFY